MVTSKQLTFNTFANPGAVLVHTAVGRSEITVRTLPGFDVYVGGSDVTIDNGYKLNLSTVYFPHYQFELLDGESLYAVGNAAPLYVLVTSLLPK